MAKVFVLPLPKGRREGEPIDGYAVEDHIDIVLRSFASQYEAIDWARRQRHSPVVALAPLANKAVPDHWRAAP